MEGQGTAADPAAHHLPGRGRRSERRTPVLVAAAGRPETNKLYRTECRWWKEIEVIIVIGAKTGKVEANNTGIKHIKRTARGYRNSGNYKSIILMRSAVRTAA
ncbi:transposase [Arthrobacter humicola]|uniref:transposase n=1 Tax=Arthrobacter humicola TaxID=409291 RepID=UPI001FAC7AB6|nr:transposase [Arthrobacter humicola]